MQAIRSALVTALKNDATLMGMLGGPDMILNERDLTPNEANYPLIIITFQGSRPLAPQHPHLSVETWTLRIYDSGNGYFRISEIQERIKTILHRATITLPNDPTLPATEQQGILDINWVWYTPDYYDTDFNAENAGVRFHITTVDYNQSFTR